MNQPFPPNCRCVVRFNHGKAFGPYWFVNAPWADEGYELAVIDDFGDLIVID